MFPDGFSKRCYERFVVTSQARNFFIIHCIKTTLWTVWQFISIVSKGKIKTAVAKIWIAKSVWEKANLSIKVHICSDHFEDDCFGFPWILEIQSDLFKDIYTQEQSSKIPKKTSKWTTYFLKAWRYSSQKRGSVFIFIRKY